MKNDIIIRNRGGLLAVVANIAGTFQLRGPKEALAIVQEAAPVLEAGDNPMEVLGDCLTRMAAMGAKEEAEDNLPRLVSHKEMQERTLLENPIVLFQYRATEEDAWETDCVLIDDDEGDRLVANQRHRYPGDQVNKTWRIYAVPVRGRLVRIVKQAREIENL